MAAAHHGLDDRQDLSRWAGVWAGQAGANRGAGGAHAAGGQTGSQRVDRGLLVDELLDGGEHLAGDDEEANVGVDLDAAALDLRSDAADVAEASSAEAA